jgi:hypothetical protein
MGMRWQDRQEYETIAKQRTIHPVWRGIGCLLIIFLGVAGYLFSGWFLGANAENHWIFLPPEVLNPAFAPFLPSGAVVQIVVAVLFMIFSYGALSVLYAVFFPIQPGEQDSPQLYRRKSRRR